MMSKSISPHHLPGSVNHSRGLDFLVDAGKGVHGKMQVYLEITLQSIMQVLEFFSTFCDLGNVPAERNKVRRFHDLRQKVRIRVTKDGVPLHLGQLRACLRSWHSRLLLF